MIWCEMSGVLFGGNGFFLFSISDGFYGFADIAFIVFLHFSFAVKTINNELILLS